MSILIFFHKTVEQLSFQIRKIVLL